MQAVCLCPTFGRPSLVRNALALFLAQDLAPGQSAHLLIYADDGLIPTQSGGKPPLTWDVWGTNDWVPLTAKYAPMLAHAAPLCPDAWIVWDDDDVYLPRHVQQHLAALQAAPWSHPSRAYSTYGIDPQIQHPVDRTLSGRHYHGALAVRADLMTSLGGWPNTDRSNYDKQMLAACRNAAGPPADPCQYGHPTYVYRWSDTSRDHCSARIQQGRYRRPRIQEPPIDRLTPAYDLPTASLLRRLCP